MTFLIPPVAIIPVSTGFPMSYVGAYKYSEFASAPLQSGDFAIYFSTVTSTLPIGGSGNAWADLPAGTSRLKTKVLEAGDLGVGPTNPDPSTDSGARFVVYRGPGSMILKKSGDPRGYSYTKNVKHCGTLIYSEEATNVNFRATMPAAWTNRISRTKTSGSSARTTMWLFDRLEPANTLYVDGAAIDGTLSGSNPTLDFTTNVFEFLIP